MITVISGSRRVQDYKIVEAAIKASGFTITKVIEGGQRTWDKDHNTVIDGVDFFAEVWARKPPDSVA